MTFNLQNALPFGTGAEQAAAMVYMHDTFLSGLPQYTVSSHPTGATFKRSYFRTCTNWVTSQPYTEYFYSSWTSPTAPSRLYLYGDDTYTTTPGDLGTSTTYGLNSSSFSLLSDYTMRFWYSDQSNAALITVGKKLFWFDFGYTQNAFFQEGGAWDGSTRKENFYFPVIGAQESMSLSGYYMASTRTSSVPVIPLFYPYNSPLEDDKPMLVQDMIMGEASSSSNPYPSSSTRALFNVSGNDLLFYIPSDSTNTNREYCKVDTSSNDLVLNNGRYYLLTRPGLSFPGLALDFGTTEPTLT